jgi:uncharacterized membrane protein
MEPAMLSQDDRQRLEEIERHLRDEDPRFVARMQATRDRRKRTTVLLLLAMWSLAPLFAILLGWTAMFSVLPLVGIGTVLILGRQMRS